MPSSNMALFLGILATCPYTSMAASTPPGDGHADSSITASPSATLPPCGVVGSLVAAALAADAKAKPFVDAQLAYDCLNSVPLNTSAAIAYVTAIEPYIEWQSDLVDLKDPPKDFFYPPYDPVAKLASVKSNLEKGGVYANEYEFQQDLYQLSSKAHNGHFLVYPDLLTKAFQWLRQRSLVSISSNGVEVPKIYLYEDIISAPKNASVVTTINGVDAVKYVSDWVLQASFNQDADAAYNTMFYEKAFAASGATPTGYFASGGRVRYIYPGSNTTFGFENGTTLTTQNLAYVKDDFTGVTDGESFYQKFCIPKTPEPTNTNKTKLTTTAPPPAKIVVPGYPDPVVVTRDGIVGGYYLSEPGLEDVAVLSLLAFVSKSIAEFQAVSLAFLAKAVRDGKTKLIVDLQSNAGGIILQGYDEFRQLFPHILQDGFTRMRENDVHLRIAKIFSNDIPADYDYNTASDELNEKAQFWFNYRYDYNLTNQRFLTFEDKFAPHVYKGDNFTSIMRWDLDNPFLTTANSSHGLGIEVAGYGSLSNLTQPFAAENIIMVHDGFCASTCTLFAEFMRIQAGVKSVAFGGRPSSGAIQAIGGTKGAGTWTYDNLHYWAQLAAESPSATPEDIAILNRLTPLPSQRSTFASINIRDNILPDNLNGGLSAQYVVEEADCKLYWTADMITNVEKVWEAAATAAWHGGACVAGAGLSHGKRDVENKNSNTKAKKAVANEKRDFNTVDFQMETVNKNAVWRMRNEMKVVD
ncbi:hypothetical protein DSL72_005394 [Monilinia vaccinii-corymbosi]|uniref:CPAF-like PDZ domain-containing protein n=1 Tax=Monilinia vaccinii-corymbosi TaxID=61207 RepID=A0A8A3PF15_9HELO|nr:hypothetical protein DSL72_005394 [Monilinia vaccinii-corymbosi]